VLFKKGFLFFLIIIFTAVTSMAVESDKIKWYDYKSGIEQAKSQNKLVYMVFYSNSCSYCKMMDEKTFSNSEVADYLNEKFIAVRVNGDKNKEIASLYKVRAYPSSFFLKSNSDTIGYKMGYLDVKNFMKLVDFVNMEYNKS